MPRLTEQRALRAPLPASKAVFLRCSEVKGFNARIAASGTRTWYVDVTQNGKTSKIPLGPVGVLSFAGSPEDPGARDLAIAALAAAKRGKDAGEAISKKRQPKGLTLNDIWGHYETAGFPVLRGTGRKRESTISADKLRWQKHVAGTLGKVPVAEIGTAAVQRFLDRIPTEGQRAHTLVLVKSILSFAASRGLAEPQRIELTAKKSKLMQNFYGNDELAALDMGRPPLRNDSHTGSPCSRRSGSCCTAAAAPRRSSPPSGGTSISDAASSTSSATRRRNMAAPCI